MNTIPPETTNETPPPAGDPVGWAEAAKEAALIDPPPKNFRARLTVVLSNSELVEHGRRYADAEQELEEFDDKTKELAAERKSQRAEIEGRKKKHRAIFSTGREDRDVPCVEYVSLRQGRKWRVRLDTKETYAEEPLAETDRQATLPLTLLHPDDPTDGQIVEDGGDERDEEEESADSSEVTSPEDLLEAAREGEEEP